QVTSSLIFSVIVMIVGVCIALLVTYRKDSSPKEPVKKSEIPEIDMAEGITEPKNVKWEMAHTFTVIAILAALILQIVTDSLVLGALAGIIVMFVCRVVRMYEGERVVHEGVGMMGMIAFVMLIASG